MAFTTAAGTGVQVMPTILTVGGAVLSGKPFKITEQGTLLAHGAAQTLIFGLQGAAYSTGAFAGTQLAAGSASGAVTAGSSYDFYLTATLFGSNASGLVSGFYITSDNVTPSAKAVTVTAAKLTGIKFGSSVLSGTTWATNPLGAAQLPALQFALTVQASVSDTQQVFSITSFYATNDN